MGEERAQLHTPRKTAATVMNYLTYHGNGTGSTVAASDPAI